MLHLLRRTATATSEPAFIDLATAAGTVRVALKRSAAARRFTLRVRSATRDVVLTMPARGSIVSARAFAARNAKWVEARLQGLPSPVAFEPGAIVPVRGVDHVIVHCQSGRRAVWVESAAGGPAAMSLCVSGPAAHVNRRVRDYLRREAKSDLEAAVGAHSRTVKRAVLAINLRDGQSRWGSCSSRGTLNFSWRLILAPAFVLDYLAAHEVAHLVHMDHSPAFWRLAGTLSPKLAQAEAWLKAHGSGLHRFGK